MHAIWEFVQLFQKFAADVIVGNECQSCSTCISCLEICFVFTLLRQSLERGALVQAEHTSGRFSRQHLHCRPSADGTFKVLAIPEVSLRAGLSAHKQSGPNLHLGLGRDK